MRKELETRLISLSINIEKLCNGFVPGFMSEHLSKQIIRSSTSAALNYGEAQAAESRNDFIHKISIVLKELRETQISLNLLSGSIKDNQEVQMQACQKECDELVAIFHKTVMTAKSNAK
jgi:four helix bundle protein